MSNAEILEYYMNDDNGGNLIKKCVDCQFAKLPIADNWKKQYQEDFYHDLIIYLMDYPKLEKVHKEGHMNACVTRIILNQIYSSSSSFYHTYLKPIMKMNELKDIKDDNTSIWQELGK